MTSQPGPTSSEPILRAVRIGKVFPDGQVTALADLTVEIPRGQYVAVMGPSGSGKSTLLHLLGGLDAPSSGEVYFEGINLARAADIDQIRARRIGFVFQSFHLLPTLTCLENVQVPMFEGVLPLPRRVERARLLLEQTGLGHRLHHCPGQLSVGERQRVAICRALANEPVLLLADEPTGNLDSASGSEILHLFDRLHDADRMTLVVITHSEEVAHRAQRILRMRDGRLVADELVREA